MKPTIRVTGILEWGLGVSRGRRFRAEFDGRPIGLPDAEFRIFTILALARVGMIRTGPRLDPTGWIHAEHLLIPRNHLRVYLFKLKSRIYRQIPALSDWPPFVTDNCQWHRLNTDRDKIIVDAKSLVNCPLPDIALIVKRARKRYPNSFR